MTAIRFSLIALSPLKLRVPSRRHLRAGEQREAEHEPVLKREQMLLDLNVGMARVPDEPEGDEWRPH